jgi:site-specific recombinase XerD
MLAEHLAGRTTGRVFVTKNGKPLAKDSVRHSLHRVLAHLEIPKGGLHAFRHGRVSMLQKGGVPGDLIIKWVGHSNLRTTSSYTHFDDQYQKNIVQQVGLFAQEAAA